MGVGGPEYKLKRPGSKSQPEKKPEIVILMILNAGNKSLIIFGWVGGGEFLGAKTGLFLKAQNCGLSPQKLKLFILYMHLVTVSHITLRVSVQF